MLTAVSFMDAMQTFVAAMQTLMDAMLMFVVQWARRAEVQKLSSTKQKLKKAEKAEKSEGKDKQAVKKKEGSSPAAKVSSL